MHKQDHLQALILHRRAYRETSFILDIFCRELGKISAVSKGGRSAKGEKKSLLQPFQPLSLSLFGRHELKNLGQVEAAGQSFRLSGDGLFSAMYLNELLNRTLPVEAPFEPVYDHYLASLSRLQDDATIEPVLREFELQLLSELGYGLEWGHDWQSGEAIQAHAHYCFVRQQGWQKLPGPNQTKNCFAGLSLLKIARQEWDKDSLHSAKRVIRMAFSPLLGDKPLKSRALFQQTE